MGLDMYLKASKYIGNWQHNTIQERAQFAAVMAGCGLEPGDATEGSPHVTPSVCVAYWRKANAIHAWFVKEIQNGNDECLEHGVPREKLTELMALCQKAKETKDASLLPPMEGFFFGSTDIDEGYWADIDHTIEQLSSILGNPRLASWNFAYHSSW